MTHRLPSFRNEITISTPDRICEMEVRAYAERITAPVLMILASKDTVAGDHHPPRRHPPRLIGTRTTPVRDAVEGSVHAALLRAAPLHVTHVSN